MRNLYLAALFVGLVLAVVLYFVIFDDLSETELVTLSPLWVLLIAFGATGLFAEKGAGLVAAGEAPDLDAGLKMAARAGSPLAYFVVLWLPLKIYNFARGQTTRSRWPSSRRCSGRCCSTSSSSSSSPSCRNAPCTATTSARRSTPS